VGYLDKIFVTKNSNINFFNIKIMSFINEMLQQPSYGWQDENGELIKPSLQQLFKEAGHGNGEIKHRVGIDYDRRNLSINQIRPGLFSGEWHNNHHLYPASARAGFLPYQVDLAWMIIYAMYKIGVVSSYHDSKKEFLRRYKGYATNIESK
jgi:hypothetical protein